MKIRTFHKALYPKVLAHRLPLKCSNVLCSHVIQEGEQYEITDHGKRLFCETCMNAEFIVYPMVRHYHPHNKVTGFKTSKNVDLSSFRQE